MPTATAELIRSEIAEALPGLAPVSRGMPTRPTEEGDDDETIADLWDALHALKSPTSRKLTPVDIASIQRQVEQFFADSLPPNTVVFGIKSAVYLDTTGESPKLIWLPGCMAVDFPRKQFVLRPRYSPDETSVIDSPAISAEIAAIDACD